MSNAKIEWFNGNKYGLEIYNFFVELAHTWDDLVDKDKEVSEAEINRAFYIALVGLPANPLYAQIQNQVLPLWITVINAYAVANSYERAKDDHGLEVGHSLRYAAGNIISYIVFICNGAEKAAQIMPEVWKNIVSERFDDYRKEHLNVD